ncbi:MAG TPA: DUF2510 domain-containing protein, partial [Acidimicrobiia bacterium]|nr:DUF2510 domain-containing protein [Acidimicrobiia bacterium]
MSQDAGWHRDPTGRHAQRYWDGKWTGFVAGAGGGDAEPDPLLPSEQFPPPGQELPAPSTPAPVETEAAATTTSLIATSATATAPAPVPAPIPSPGPPSPPPPPSTPPANWYADPAARHHHRYWDGSAWTSHVADGGQSGDEPLDPAYQDAVPVPMRQTTPAAVQPTAAQGSPMAPTSQSPYPAADGAAPSLGAVASSEAAPSTLPGASPAPSSVMFDPPAVAEPPTAAGAWAASPVQAAGASSPVTASKRSGWDLSRWVQLGALVAMAVGVLTAWATTSNSFVS